MNLKNLGGYTMIKGFIVKGMTVKGSAEVKRNSRLPFVARRILSKKILNKDPFVVRFLFKKNLLKTNFLEKNKNIYSEEGLVNGLKEEMKDCIEGFDYMIEVL